MRRIPVLLLTAMTAFAAVAKTTTIVQFSTTSDKLIVSAVWSYEITSLYGSPVAVVTGVSPTPIGALTVPAVMVDDMGTPADDSDDVPYPVKYVGAYALSNHMGMTSVTLPETLIDLGEGAFKNCNSLQSVSLNSGLQHIGKRPFENTAITTLALPYTLKTMDGNVVAGCETFESFTIESSLYFSLADGVLYDKKFKTLYSCPAGTTTVRIQSSTQTIGDEAFAGCWLLDSLEIPRLVTKIGTDVFAGCDSLTALSFDGETAPLLADDDFLVDTDLSLIVLVPDESTGWFDDVGKDEDFPSGRSWPEDADPANQRQIKRESANIDYSCNYASSGNLIWSYRVINGKAELYGEEGSVAAIHYSTQQSYTFSETTGQWEPDGVLNVPASLDGYAVTSIGSNAFLNCSSLGTVVLPDTITTIDDFAFKGCSGITEIELPSRVSTIGYHAFEGTFLTTLALPDNLRILRGNPAAGCDTLQFYSLSENNSYFAVSDNVLYDADFETLISCPARRPSVSIPSTVRTIGSEAFHGCCRLAVISLPEALEKAEDEAFAGCNRLQELSFASNLTALVGNGLFTGCSNLKKINFAGNAPTVLPDLLAGTPSDLVIHVDEDTTGWKEAASTALPDDALWPVGGTTRRSIVRDALLVDAYETSDNWKYKVVEGVAEICGTVTKPSGAVTIPETVDGYVVTSIGTNALTNLKLVNSITLPAYLERIADGALAGCTRLESITVAEGNIDYASNDGALYDYDQTTLLLCPARQKTLTVPSTVTDLAAGALADCTVLEKVTFEGNAPTLHDDLYGATPAKLITAVAADTTGWKDSSIALPADELWPATGARRTIVRDVTVESASTTIDGVTWTYAVEGGEAILTGVAVDDDFAGTLTLPSTLGGCYVTDVTADAFNDVEGVTSFAVATDNIGFSARNGVLYSADGTTLVRVPNGFIFAATATTNATTVGITVTQRAVDGEITSACTTNSATHKTTVASSEPTLSSTELFAGVSRIADGAFTGCGAGGASEGSIYTTNSTETISSNSGITGGHVWATLTQTHVITETTVEYVEKLTVPGGISYSRTRAFVDSNFTDVEEEAPKLLLATGALMEEGVVSLVCPTVEEKVYTVWKTEKLGGTWVKAAEYSGTGEAVEFLDANKSSSGFYKVTVESAP